MLGGAKTHISGQRRGSGGGVLGERQLAFSPPARGWGKLISARFGAEPWPLKGFLAFYRGRMVSPGTCWGPRSGGEPWPPRPPPLQSAYECNVCEVVRRLHLRRVVQSRLNVGARGLKMHSN